MRKRDELSDPSSCLNRAQEGEWCFVLLGRDESACDAVREWIASRIRRGKNRPGDPKLIEAQAWIAAVEEERRLRQQLRPGLYRVAEGGFAGALVRCHFVNSLANADCRFAEDFGPHGKGEIIALDPLKLAWVGE